MNLIRFGFDYDFDVALLCFWYGYGVDMALECFDMLLMWFGNGAPSLGFPMGWLQERRQKQLRDRLLVHFSMFFGFGFGMF